MEILCPICKEKLNLVNKSYYCLNKHCFDLAKEGYLNLNLKNSQNTGDENEMIKARKRFLEKDYYHFLRAEINNEVDRIIFDELCKGEIKDSSKKYFVDVINNMIQEDGIKGIILGCTEIEMLVKQNDLSIPIFDTTQSHIDSIVDYSLERK